MEEILSAESKHFNSFQPTSCNEAKNSVRILQAPIKSPNDKNLYKIILLPNGLQICLIEEPLKEAKNPEEKLAAASLCIKVGTFSDPDDIPGLAHFLEHIVFMGSEKYPEENDFDAFIRTLGGFENATTDIESTNFYFDCLNQNFFMALDKFAQFFISPLMRRDSIVREREIIDAEFRKAMIKDSVRLDHLYTTMASANSPLQKFGWGNLETLKDNVADEVLYEKVHEFRRRHYSAHRMTLAVKSNSPIDELEEHVTKLFSQIPSNFLPGLDFTQYENKMFDQSKFNMVYHLRPITDTNVLTLTWLLPPQINNYKSKPLNYIAHLLTQDCKDSLLGYLKQRSWVVELKTNDCTELRNNTIFSLFTLRVTLVENGYANKHKIIKTIFSYIQYLKQIGPQQRIFDELKHISDIRYRFQNSESPLELVRRITNAMKYYPTEDYLQCHTIYYEYGPEDINMILNLLTPTNLNIIIQMSPDTKYRSTTEMDQVEHYFSLRYSAKHISKQWLKVWSKIKPYKSFQLPNPNTFITSNFSIIDFTRIDVPLYPEKIIDKDFEELWHKPDDKFKQPIAYIYYSFTSDLIEQSMKNTVCFNFLISELEIELKDKLALALENLLNFKVAFENYGISIKCEGLNENLEQFLMRIMTTLVLIPSRIEQVFHFTLQNAHLDFYESLRFNSEALARNLQWSILSKSHYPGYAKKQLIEQILPGEFREFSAKFLSSLHIQALIQGNYTKEDALRIHNNVKLVLRNSQLAVASFKPLQVAILPLRKHIYRIRAFNLQDSNSLIVNYYQMGPGTIKQMCLLKLFLLIIREPMFYILRTKEQIGYEIDCRDCDMYGILGFIISITTRVEKYTTEQVDNRIEAFLQQMRVDIKNMNDDTIELIKSNFIKTRKLADLDLETDVNRNWEEIIRQQFIFDKLSKQVLAIESITTEEFKNWVDASLNPENIRKLSVQVAGHMKPKNDSVNENNAMETDNYGSKSTDAFYIPDVFEFRRGLNYYPAHRITS